MSLFKKKHVKKVQLVLGSGGARGIAHIAIIEELLRDGFEIELVIGCSMGAVVGGIYCTGHLSVYRDWLLTLNRQHVFNLLDFTLSHIGFVKGDRILGKMQDITGDQLIEDLSIPFVAVATDIVRGEEVFFRAGDLYHAMRASISIPGVFTPVMQDGTMLVDGGILNPLPLNAVSKSKDTIVIAVSLNGRDEDWNTSPKSQNLFDADTLVEDEHQQWWMRHFPYLKTKPKEGPKYSLINLLANSYEFTQDRLVEMTIEKYKPDLVIDIPRASCGLYDFHKAAHLMELGRERYTLRMGEFQEKRVQSKKYKIF